MLELTAVSDVDSDVVAGRGAADSVVTARVDGAGAPEALHRHRADSGGAYRAAMAGQMDPGAPRTALRLPPAAVTPSSPPWAAVQLNVSGGSTIQGNSSLATASPARTVYAELYAPGRQAPTQRHGRVFSLAAITSSSSPAARAPPAVPPSCSWPMSPARP
ncbi:hypothetical protein [Candidatus Amarobacter glycogenicus]|uniref:hypothetical protein n=1 Tax=Candidatus Amarobacter glycogenicus TaxID=3140699 RepID=UPI003134AC61|nr:hypothetical protein [Dehalococcoidia bacterium]